MSEFEDIEIWGEKDKTSSSSVENKKKPGQEKKAVAQSSSGSNKSLLYGLLGVLFLGALAVGAFLLLSGGGEDSSDSATAKEGSSEQGDSETNTGGEGSVEGETPLEIAYNGGKTADGVPLLLSDTLPFPDSTELIDKIKSDGSAWVVVDQKGMRLKVSGEVPDEASKEAIETSMKQTWRDLAKSEITVNDSLEGGAWLQDMPAAMKTVAAMGSDTSMSVNNSKLYLDGDTRRDSYKERYMTILGNFENLPEIENNLVKTGDIDQGIDIKVEGGKATLAGFVDSQGVRDTLEYHLHNQYGAENVTNVMEIRDGVKSGILTLGLDGNIKVFSAFSSHRLKIVFSEKAEQIQFSGSITSGIAFEPGSTKLSPTLVNSLEGFIALSNRTGRPIQIIGHTDSDGDDTFNLELSKQRAEEAKQAFLALGFPEERLNTFGRGEEQLLVEEKTEADKKLNRRVEIILGELEE